MKNNKGIALIATFFVICILLIFLGAFLSTDINQSVTSDIFRRRTKAFYLAESGLDQAITWLRSQPSPPVGNHTDPWGGIQNLGGGTYSVTITDLGIIAGSGSVRRYQVTSTGSFRNLNRSVSSYIQVDNYSRYLWFTDREVFNGTTVWFWTQDHLNGPTQTNGHFNIMGNPIFESQARSVDTYIRFFNNGNNINLSQTTNPPYDSPDFQQGMFFGVTPTTMPNRAQALRNAAAAGGLSLTGNSTVVLLSDGTMNVTNPGREWTNHNMALPANGTLFVNSGNLTISGTLSGRLTVGANQNVIIPNNILYADDPRTNPDSTDVLGIIAEEDVILTSGAPSDLEIDACIMAMGTSFYMQNWWIGPPKGTLTVFGGIIQDERGPVGTFNSSTGQKVSGYSKDYEYDQRLLGSPPPFMPTTGDYVVLSWEEN
ncbi:MAG: hypothetical protein PHT31_03540 [Candidatus Omnitrophica bacterium]|nr:hypothetical protein [Candidatus Omnitrophota bacterium]